MNNTTEKLAEALRDIDEDGDYWHAACLSGWSDGGVGQVRFLSTARVAASAPETPRRCWAAKRDACKHRGEPLTWTD